MKFLWLLVLASIACRLLAGRWPWELLPTSGRSQGAAKARNLLGVGRQASRTDIIEAHRRLVSQVHPDRGGTNDQVIEANAARDLLLSSLTPDKPERK